jgi:hypothetical protein
VFEKGVLSRIFGPKRDEVTEIGENCIMKSFITCTPRQTISMINSRRMRWAGHVARMGEKRNACSILVGKPERKETTRKTKR